MDVPLTMGFDDQKVIGVVRINDDVDIDWLKFGFAEVIYNPAGKAKLLSVGLMLKVMRVNHELEIVDGKLRVKDKKG